MKLKFLCQSMVAACALLVGVAYANNPMVEIKTNTGTLVAELYADKAPLTVKNFLSYVDSGFYNGTVFHRTIAKFMIQGGGFAPGLKQKPTHDPIKNEASPLLQNKPGTLAMARTNDPDSATSQFFINLNDNKHLNFYKPQPDYIGYAVFGRIVKGYEVAEKISTVPTHAVGNFDDVPTNDVVIESITRIAEAAPASPAAPAKKPAVKKKVVKKKTT
ncbi:peptidylprolyl isomerase [Leeia oryzae]|uniref:peptidylprolyl isomerase n=1 Tax=Leeia oryzae TaxID=356662 RepID=UPI00036C523C|nr:peptidylprolyl isomerase [Leeia oryzae]